MLRYFIKLISGGAKGGSKNVCPRSNFFFYRPQRSWAKVMFLQASVILLMGGVCLSACWDTPPWEQTSPRSRHNPPRSRPPGADTPLEQPPPRADPPEQTPPRSRHPQEQTPPKADTPLGADTPSRSRPPPGKQTPAYGQRAAGTHPTGMHSCLMQFSAKIMAK